MSELEPRLSEADVQKVLARASELQAERAGTLSVTQLREIAAEMSIPESVVDQALQEFRGNVTERQAPTRTLEERRRNPHPIVLATAAVGAAMAFLLGTVMIMRLFP